MNEKHFHGIRNLKGGLPEPENEDALYWQRSAEGALIALGHLTDKADDLVADFWHDGNTWKTICEMTEAKLKEAREQK